MATTSVDMEGNDQDPGKEIIIDEERGRNLRAWPIPLDDEVSQLAVKAAEESHHHDSKTQEPQAHPGITRVFSRRSATSFDPGPAPDGGLTAWIQVFCTHLTILTTFGFFTSFGVYQTYYEHTLGIAPSTISWIGVHPSVPPVRHRHLHWSGNRRRLLPPRVHRRRRFPDCGDLHNGAEHKALAAISKPGCVSWDRERAAVLPVYGVGLDLLCQETRICAGHHRIRIVHWRRHLPCHRPAVFAAHWIPVDDTYHWVHHARFECDYYRAVSHASTAPEGRPYCRLGVIQRATLFALLHWHVLLFLGSIFRFLLYRGVWPECPRCELPAEYQSTSCANLHGLRFPPRTDVLCGQGRESECPNPIRVHRRGDDVRLDRHTLRRRSLCICCRIWILERCHPGAMACCHWVVGSDAGSEESGC